MKNWRIPSGSGIRHFARCLCPKPREVRASLPPKIYALSGWARTGTISLYETVSILPSNVLRLRQLEIKAVNRAEPIHLQAHCHRVLFKLALLETLFEMLPAEMGKARLVTRRRRFLSLLTLFALGVGA